MSYYQSLFVTSFKESICVIKCIFEIFSAISSFFFQCWRSRWVVFLSSRHHTLWLYSGQSRCCSQSGRKELRSEYQEGKNNFMHFTTQVTNTSFYPSPTLSISAVNFCNFLQACLSISQLTRHRALLFCRFNPCS